jgi:hypothetical protein
LLNKRHQRESLFPHEGVYLCWTSLLPCGVLLWWLVLLLLSRGKCVHSKHLHQRTPRAGYYKPGTTGGHFMDCCVGTHLTEEQVEECVATCSQAWAPSEKHDIWIPQNYVLWPFFRLFLFPGICNFFCL